MGLNQQNLSPLVFATIGILAASDAKEADIEFQVMALVQDAMFARRLIDCIPEAFGLVLAHHLTNVGVFAIPSTFSAKDAEGNLRSFPMVAEPIFTVATEIATHMFHNGPRSTVEAVCKRSALVGAINNGLNAGGTLDGATLAGPMMIGISAEIYLL